MTKYSMNQIVTLTGIKAHTLRKWETRYSFLEPERTDTNIRFYSDGQLKKLLNISVLTRNGYRISKIDKMSEDEIHDAVTNKLLTNNAEDEISALVLSMLEMNEVKFDNIFKSQIIKRGLLNTTVDLIYPFLNKVGVLWGINKVMPAQEHFISNLIKKRLFSIIDLLPYPKENASIIVMFLPENEYHEIGLLLAYYIARELGWKVCYLGQNVPTNNIKQVVEEIKPNAMLTMFVTSVDESIETTINDILSQGEVSLLVSGNPVNLEKIVEDKRIIPMSNPHDLINYLKQIS